MPARKGKVLVAMSGGVDSSVAAALLLREGYDVVGCFMRLGSPGETLDELELVDSHRRDACATRPLRIGHQGCCSINDAADARLVAAKLGIPFYVCNFKKDFGRIIDYFVGEYNAGRTPNPCVRCNDWLKFGKLHDYAKQIDAEYVASGHYARVDATNGSPRLLRGIDHDKDQSYVLFGAPRNRLAEMLLPIGGYRKSEVRAIARELDLPVFDKPDSQEICFVPDNDYAGLVTRRSPEQVRPGRILDTAGNDLGEHAGHQHYTIGQRRGIGIALGHPVYVVDKNHRDNTITIGEKDDLRAHGCTATEANWLLPPPRDGAWIDCAAKIRSNAEPVPACVGMRGDDGIEVRFADPQYAVAPGQAVVCYDGDAVLCGGWIDRAAAPRGGGGGDS
jgi:tRNA-specific 2-thiouridylase